MTTMYERAKQELIYAGYDLNNKKEQFENDKDYADSIGICALEIVKVFCEQDHSGFSASITIDLITKLLKGEIITPLTNNPDEWVYHKETKCYQSKRKFSCFSEDNLQTYYDIDERPSKPRKYHKLSAKKESEE